MAWTNSKPHLVAGVAIVLVAGIVVMSPTGLSGGRLKLPVGQGAPAISLGQTHGLILASDGSLWSWGSDFLGWPVLGLGNVTGQTRLRRIGSDTNWVSITAGEATTSPSNRTGHFGPWGQNIYGQFGVGTMGKQNMMTNIPAPAAPGHDWKQAAAGGDHTVA